MTTPAPATVDIAAFITDAVSQAMGARTATLDGQLPVGYAILGYPREGDTTMTIWGPYADIESAEADAQRRRDDPDPERYVRLVALYELDPDTAA